LNEDTITVHTEGPNAFENAKSQLVAQDAEPDEIREVHVEMTVGDRSDVAEQMDVIAQFSQLRTEGVDIESGSQMTATRAYPVLRFISDNASEEYPVEAGDIRDATGLGDTASGTLSELYGADIVNRVDYTEEEGKAMFAYTGLTARGRAELEKFEAIMNED